jgi:hypothetical protein
MSAAASAHRRDEYLQAARISIDRGRVQIEVDLTAGISVADAVIRDIDRDQSGFVSALEARAYGIAAVKAMRLEIDRKPLDVELLNVAVPDLQVIRQGEAAIRLEIGARLPTLPAGPHQVFFVNAHRPEISVYLANALVPVSPQVVVSAQRRDVAQREITVDYVLTPTSPSRSRTLLPLGAVTMVFLVAVGWIRQWS